MNLDKLTTEELRKELERREQADKERIGFPHLFLYSKTFNQFETELMPVPSPKDLQLIPLQLRCRYNTHRDLKLFSIKLTAEEGRQLNEVLKDESVHEKTFTLIEKALIELPI